MGLPPGVPMVVHSAISGAAVPVRADEGGFVALLNLYNLYDAISDLKEEQDVNDGDIDGMVAKGGPDAGEGGEALSRWGTATTAEGRRPPNHFRPRRGVHCDPYPQTIGVSHSPRRMRCPEAAQNELAGGIGGGLGHYPQRHPVRHGLFPVGHVDHGAGGELPELV